MPSKITSGQSDSGCDNGVLLLGYLDPQNYWVNVYSKAQNKWLLYHVAQL
jgi:hypothetical protein